MLVQDPKIKNYKSLKNLLLLFVSLVDIALLAHIIYIGNKELIFYIGLTFVFFGLVYYVLFTRFNRYKVFVVIVFSLLAGYLTFISYNKARITLVNVNQKFSGTVFMLFNQPNANKIPVDDNILILNIPAGKDFTKITSTKYKQFTKNNIYIIDGDEKSHYIEDIENLESKRIFSFKLDSMKINPERYFYFCTFLVTPDKLSNKRPELSSHLNEYNQELDSIKNIIYNKLNSK